MLLNKEKLDILYKDEERGAVAWKHDFLRILREVV